MATKLIRYIGHAAEGVEVDEPHWYGFFPQGEPVEVPDDIAGRPPSGTPGEEGYDLGEGLLAQVTFELVGAAPPPSPSGDHEDPPPFDSAAAPAGEEVTHG